MNVSRLFRLVEWSLLLILLFFASGSLPAADMRPNIIVILADDLGYADTGFQGSKDLSTPNLDKLADSGIRFTSGYSSHPFCSPMRAGLVTGRYQHRFGYERNIAFDPHNHRMGLPAGETTVADRLKKAGYLTGAIGKWHLGASSPFLPNRRGFDFFYGFPGGGHDYFSVDLNRPMAEAYRQPLHRNGQPESLTQYLTDALSDEAVAFVQRVSGKPFFLYLAYNAPHTPMQAPRSYMDKFASIPDNKRRTYAAMVYAMDLGVGRLLHALDALEIRQQTLVFFLSDNGGPESANASDNGPLKGGKGDVTEGGIRVPFVLSWPGTLPSQTTADSPVISLDLAATALAAAGIPIPEGLEGMDLVGMLKDRFSAPPSRTLFWRKENGTSWAVRAGSMKLLQTRENAPLELYDLEMDIGETRNLASNRPDDVRRLHALYQEWNRGNQPPFFPSYREYHQRMKQVYEEITTPDNQ